MAELGLELPTLIRERSCVDLKTDFRTIEEYDGTRATGAANLHLSELVSKSLQDHLLGDSGVREVGRRSIDAADLGDWEGLIPDLVPLGATYEIKEDLFFGYLPDGPGTLAIIDDTTKDFNVAFPAEALLDYRDTFAHFDSEHDLPVDPKLQVVVVPAMTILPGAITRLDQ